LQDELKRLTDALEQKDANIRHMAEHVLAAKQALIEKDSEEAYHQLYALAEYRAKTPLEPWAGLEKLLLDGESTQSGDESRTVTGNCPIKQPVR